MSVDINIDHSTFGHLSGQADCLVIELSNSLISFCEFETGANQPLYITHYPVDSTLHQPVNDQLINALTHFGFMKKKYPHVYVNYFDSQYTLCPATFYTMENSRSILEFNTGSSADKIILTDDVTPDIKLIYALDELLKSTLDQLFPHHQLKHTINVLSRLMLQTEELIKEDILLVIHSDHIEIVMKQAKKLSLANQFTIKTQEDILYYVLFILEQYQRNPLTVNISVAGNIDSSSGLMSSLKKYIKNIRLAIGHKNINWTGIQGSPQHFNYTLLNRLFCE